MTLIQALKKAQQKNDLIVIQRSDIENPFELYVRPSPSKNLEPWFEWEPNEVELLTLSDLITDKWEEL